MDNNPYAPQFEDLPESLPVFPLTGVLLLPGGQLPLNIFESRYLEMVDHALAGNRLIGMIQPLLTTEPGKEARPDLHKTGCAGKITEFSETPDGRYLITLSGICRFAVDQELKINTPYRQIVPIWEDYQDDLTTQSCLGLDRAHLHDLLKNYFNKEELDCDWAAVENTPDNKLITCLSMICPFEAREKQALLEAQCCKTRGELFIAMLEMAVKGNCQKAGSAH